MPISLSRTKEIREIIYDLNLNNLMDRRVYDPLTFEFISQNEASGGVPILQVYDDGKGYATIGYGFNMDTAGSRTVWSEALGQKIPFDRTKRGEIGITIEQAFMLYSRSRMINLKELNGIYGSAWKLLRANEKLMIEDLYFNAGNKLVGRQTRFYKNIINYTETSNIGHLKEAIVEVRERSNLERISNPALALGIQNRRNVQAAMGEE